MNVTKTKELDLCVSCEICSAACPEEAITMEHMFGQFLPKVSDEKCTNCGFCLAICPGIDIDPFGLRYERIYHYTFDGPCLNCYTAYCKDPNIRKNSASGGLITTLVIELLKNKEFDVGFVLPFNIFTGKSVRLKATNEIDEIFNSARSKYIPTSAYEVIVALKRRDNRKYIIVGTPCVILGIKKYLKKSKISEDNLLFLGLFCGRTLNFNVIQYFEAIYKKPREKLIGFEFRTKERYGWPGDSKLYFDSGRELIVNKRIRGQLTRYFQLNRCLFCLDKLNQLADISFGDCYIGGKGDSYGKSSVIMRTEKGKKIFDAHSYLFTIEEESVETIRKSQGLMIRMDNLENVKLIIKKNNIYPNSTSDYNINQKQVSRRLSKLQTYIRHGKNFNINRIKISLFLSRILQTTTLAAATIGIAILEDLLIRGWIKRIHISKKLSTKSNIIIIGGGLFNKGAQAMTFTVVDQLKRRLPNKNIYLFSTSDFEREGEEKSIYKFNILPWDTIIKIQFLSFLGELFRKNSNCEHMKNHLRDVIENVDFFIDISGYALSSQWGFLTSINYLLDIIIAKKFSVPYYIFPQSIGPFDYRLMHKIFLYPLMKMYLKYPKKIFTREEDGLECLRKFTKRNSEKSCDIVLQNTGYNLNNIYNKEINFKDIRIEPNSVGVIPSLVVTERASPYDLYSVYGSLIGRLIDAGKLVYILRHSYDDLLVCEEIKRLFPDNSSVRLIRDDLNAIELENILKQFDFVIASRYHSTIHSYKNGVPALVIGWATKYFELLRDFCQLDYFFDVRNKIDTVEICSKLDKLIQNYKYEKEIITNKMNTLNKVNIFNIFGEEK